MSLTFESQFSQHRDTLQVRSERTRLLAGNIANANTPGYQARDLDFKATLQEMQQEGLPSGDRHTMAEPLYRTQLQPGPDGNTVDLSIEQAEFAQNALEFQTSLRFVSMKLSGLHKAINGQ